MNQMKKIFFLLISVAVFIIPLCWNASAKQDSQTPVSPALSIIASDLQMRKSGLTNNALYLTSTDFEEFLGLENIKSVTINTLPSEFEGKLYLGNVPVIANQTVYKTDMNKLRFVPESADVSSATFRFSGNGISCETPIKCSLYLLPEINTAPVISEDVINSEKLTTQKNIMVYSTLHAEDSENDQMIFEVTTEAKHGIVSFTDSNKGSFTYTPASDYTGKDKFEYVVFDIYGNRSEKAWVEIVVEKNNDNIFYTDMLRREEHNDAVKASAYDIMSGKIIEGKLCFAPDSTPTKAEFLVMALKAAGLEDTLISVDTVFVDDSDIPTALKGYVAYAVQKGYISGTKKDQGVFFYPNSPITRAEAAVMINNIINAQCDKKSVVFSDSNDIPSWAQEDVATLAELNIMEALSDGRYSPNSNVTNAQAAKIFCNVFEMKLK